MLFIPEERQAQETLEVKLRCLLKCLEILCLLTSLKINSAVLQLKIINNFDL